MNDDDKLAEAFNGRLEHIEKTVRRVFPRNCPINPRTGKGKTAGRCWYYLKDGKTCPQHGDVSEAVTHYFKTGMLTFR